MRFGVVGCGVISLKGHLPSMKSLENIEVVAVTDVNENAAKKAAKKFGVKKYYTDFREMLKDDSIDAVTIATPTPTHGKIALECAEAGKHIVVEKPLTTTLAEGLAVRDTVKKNNVKLTVVQNYRFFPEVRKAKKKVLRGSIGSILTAHGVACTPWPNQWTRSTWLYNEPGVLLDFAPHLVDSLLWIINSKPEKIYAIGGDSAGHANFFTYSQILVQFQNQAIATLELLWTNMLRFSFSLMGTSGRIRVDPRYRVAFETHGIKTPVDDIRLLFESTKVIKDILRGTFFKLPLMTYEYLYSDFVNAVEKNKNPIVTIDEAVDVVAILEYAYRSIKEDKAFNFT